MLKWPFLPPADGAGGTILHPSATTWGGFQNTNRVIWQIGSLKAESSRGGRKWHFKVRVRWN